MTLQETARRISNLIWLQGVDGPELDEINQAVKDYGKQVAKEQREICKDSFVKCHEGIDALDAILDAPEPEL